MEFVPLLQAASYQHIEIPYLCPDVIYSPPFETFGQRWLRSKGLEPLPTKITLKAAQDVLDAKNSLLQAWFFFGLLEECFGYLDRNDFVRENDQGDPVLTTHKLRELRDTWLLEWLDPEDMESYVERITNAFRWRR